MKVEKDLYAYLWQDAYENNCNTYLIHGEVTLPEEIDLIVLTHSHPDHFEGLEAFLNKPAKVAMNREEERYLRESGKFLFEMMRQPMPEFRIDFYLQEGELHLGKETFHVYQTPGHSPGSLSIFWPERKALFTGDLVFYGGIGRTDFLGGNSKLIKDSIERMSHLDTELLLPGHGEMVMGKEKVLQNFELIRQSLYAYL
jgi:hydroxyacylglutathione hydrolase